MPGGTPHARAGRRGDADCRSAGRDHGRPGAPPWSGVKGGPPPPPPPDRLRLIGVAQPSTPCCFGNQRAGGGPGPARVSPQRP